MRDTLTDNWKAEQLWAGMFGKELRDDMPEIKDKRGHMKSDIATESREQIDFVKWFRLQYPKVRIFAIPNGGNRDAITGSIMRAEGVTPGVPDLYIPLWRLWIEMKRTKGSSTSDEQIEWARYLMEECGDSHFFAKGCADAMAHTVLFVKYRSMSANVEVRGARSASRGGLRPERT